MKPMITSKAVSLIMYVLPDLLGDVIWTSRKVKELSIADRRAAVQNESLRALGGAPVRTGKLARCGARLEEEETDVVGLTGGNVR